MKWLIFIMFGALMGAITVTAANAQTVIVDGKAYQIVEIDGDLLVSNEPISAWQQSGSFDDVIIEARQTQGVAQ